MKIAILSDIHGNLPALQTVTEHVDKWRPDHVIINGDIINRGPSPKACLDFVLEKRREKGWWLNQGNHEGYVLKHVGETAVSHTPIARINRPSFWTYHQLNGQVDVLQQLPHHHQLSAPDDSRIHFYHASKRNNRDGIYESSPAETVWAQIMPESTEPAPAVFCTSHTHLPHIRQINETLLINTGSVGQVCDGDTRLSYAQVTWQNGRWQAKLIRLKYDMEQTKRDFVESGFLDVCGPIGELLYIEWLTAKMYVTPWIQQWQTAVIAGEIELETAVSRFLATHQPPSPK